MEDAKSVRIYRDEIETLKVQVSLTMYIHVHVCEWICKIARILSACSIALEFSANSTLRCVSMYTSTHTHTLSHAMIVHVSSS